MHPAAFVVVLALAQTIDVHVSQRSPANFLPGGGVTIGSTEIRTTVQFPEGSRSVIVGGRTGGRGSSSSQNGRTMIQGGGGGGYSEITVTPVPVITGIEPRELTGTPNRELVGLLASGDAVERLSAVVEIERRTWSPKARAVLAPRVAPLLGDEVERVAAAAARCLAKLGEASATPQLIAHLAGRDPGRLVPVLQALGEVGDATARKPLARWADNIDLEISVAASRALNALERRLR